MNKLYIYVAVAVLLIGGGVGAYFMLSNKTQSPVSSGTQTQTSEKKSLKDLLALGVAQNCSYTTADGSGGNVLVSNGKMRGDFTTITDSGSLKTHMIVDGQTSYFWMDNQTSGFKMSFDSSTTDPAGSSATPNQVEGQINADEKVDVDCSSWVVDSAVFSLPANVRFTDYSSLMPSSGAELNAEQDTSIKVQQCAACNSAPASAQAQCKAALGCE